MLSSGGNAPLEQSKLASPISSERLKKDRRSGRRDPDQEAAKSLKEPRLFQTREFHPSDALASITPSGCPSSAACVACGLNDDLDERSIFTTHVRRPTGEDLRVPAGLTGTESAPGILDAVRELKKDRSS